MSAGKGTVPTAPAEPRLWRVADAVAGEYYPDTLCCDKYRPRRPAVIAVTMTAQERGWASPPSQFEGDTPISQRAHELLCHLCTGKTILLLGAKTECCDELGELVGLRVRLIEHRRVDVGGGIIVCCARLHPDTLAELNL